MNTHPKLSPIAIHRLKQVREQIQKQPESYCHRKFQTETECGTVCCVGGWLCVNAGLKTFSENASRLLELSKNDCWDLFFTPQELTNETTADIAYNSLDPKARAAAGVKIIDAFIARHS